MLAEGLGGVETMALRYHEALRAAGCEVMSLGPERGMLGQALVTRPVEFRPMSAHINHDPFAALTLRGVAQHFRPDLVLTHGNRATGIALLSLSGTASRTVQVVHNFRHKPQVARLRAAIAVSTPVAESVRRAHPDLPLFTVDNFAALDPHPVKPAPAAIPILGTLGRLHVNKGLDVVLDAVALLVAEGTRLHLRLGGDGPLRGALAAQIEALGIQDHVTFCGWIGRTGEYLKDLDLFLCPSRVEPFGLVVIESMAAGAPVVATDIDGPRQILKGGELGYLCAREDARAMADTIRAALSDWPETLRKANAAHDYALSHFTLEAGERRLMAALGQIAEIRA